jgi:hypothetical protein
MQYNFAVLSGKQVFKMHKLGEHDNGCISDRAPHSCGTQISWRLIWESVTSDVLLRSELGEFGQILDPLTFPYPVIKEWICNLDTDGCHLLPWSEVVGSRAYDLKDTSESIKTRIIFWRYKYGATSSGSDILDVV